MEPLTHQVENKKWKYKKIRKKYFYKSILFHNSNSVDYFTQIRRKIYTKIREEYFYESTLYQL